MPKRTDKVVEFILMSVAERMSLDSGYRRTYNFLARKRFDDIINEIDIFNQGETSFVKREQIERFIQVSAQLLKNLLGADNVKIVIETN